MRVLTVTLAFSAVFVAASVAALEVVRRVFPATHDSYIPALVGGVVVAGIAAGVYRLMR